MFINEIYKIFIIHIHIYIYTHYVVIIEILNISSKSREIIAVDKNYNLLGKVKIGY
tara:strand:+ start:696 stop:863 length:168 start_codon:yes stop_codon:yes gene_type:complete